MSNDVGLRKLEKNIWYWKRFLKFQFITMNAFSGCAESCLLYQDSARIGCSGLRLFKNHAHPFGGQNHQINRVSYPAMSHLWNSLLFCQVLGENCKHPNRFWLRNNIAKFRNGVNIAQFDKPTAFEPPSWVHWFYFLNTVAMVTWFSMLKKLNILDAYFGKVMCRNMMAFLMHR